LNLAQVARLLAGFALFFTVLLAIPLVVAIAHAETAYATVDGFVAALVTGAVVAALLHLGGRTASKDFYRREGIAVVGLAWLLAAGLGALPFVWSGALTSATAAFFESVSGLTTTGASVFGSGGNPTVESLPRSLLLWRAMLHWIGGVGIILVFTVLLPAMGVTGKNLISSEQVGVADHSQRPRLQEQSRVLFRIYIVLTGACMLGYWLCGMTPFDAMCHAFSTLATGGFSTRNLSIGAYQSLPTELVAILFMFLAGANFTLMLSTLRDRPFRLSAMWRNPEFRAYALLMAGVIAAITVVLRVDGTPLRDDALGITRDYADLGRCLRDASFQTVSIMTSTGFSSADFQNWPKTALYILILCMLVGGCTGSTAGGLKVLRLVVCWKLVVYTVNLFIQPRSVQKLKLGGDVVPNSVVSAILTLVLLWMFCIAGGTLILDIDPRLDMVSSFSACVSMMCCTGPAITEVVHLPDGAIEIANAGNIDLGPYGGYGDLFALSHVTMAILMIFGRLEVLAPLVLFVPGFWRR
jgi:trk system potassium uptake protein TrkH